MSAVSSPPLPLGHIELIDGREIAKPLPKKLHILIQSYLIVALSKLLPGRYVALPECNTLTGAQTTDGRREYIVPDLVVVLRSARYEDGDLAQAPVLGVEILSPGQTIGELFTRAERLLKLGCPTVWVIWPEKRKAWEYGADLSLEEARSELTLPLPATEGEPEYVKIQVSDMWAELDRT